MTYWSERVDDTISALGTLAPGADDHRRGHVARDIIETVRACTIGATGARGSSERRQLRTSMFLVQDGRCAWCSEPMDTDTYGPDRLELDRVAKGREYLPSCGSECVPSECRCGYVLGGVVGSHARCHRDPEGNGARPLRYRLPADEVRERVATVLGRAHAMRAMTRRGPSAYRIAGVDAKGRVA